MLICCIFRDMTVTLFCCCHIPYLVKYLEILIFFYICVAQHHHTNNNNEIFQPLNQLIQVLVSNSLLW